MHNSLILIANKHIYLNRVMHSFISLPKYDVVFRYSELFENAINHFLHILKEFQWHATGIWNNSSSFQLLSLTNFSTWEHTQNPKNFHRGKFLIDFSADSSNSLHFLYNFKDFPKVLLRNFSFPAHPPYDPDRRLLNFRGIIQTWCPNNVFSVLREASAFIMFFFAMKVK